MNRRRFLQYAVFGMGATLYPSTGMTGNFLVKRFLSLPAIERPFITPENRFYVVNYSSPVKIDPSNWSLEITGRVKKPLRFGYQDVLNQPAVEKMVTLQCIDNEVGGELISNAVWKGVYLKTLIKMCDPEGMIEDVAFYGADSYSDSITFDRAMNYDVFLAYEMNGNPLTKEHGFPLRAVVPGLYGIKNVKWLVKIELVNYNYKGYWQQKGWTDEGEMKVTSKIDSPGPYNTVKGSTLFRGMAFSGYNGISDVEISLNNGHTWNLATIERNTSYSLSPYSWVFWKYEWKKPPQGAYNIFVRATDRMGRTQTDFTARAFPDGTSGLHSVVTFIN